MLLHCRKIQLLFHLRPRYRLHFNPSKRFWGLIPPSASLTSRDNYNIYCLLLAELHSVFSLLSRGEKAASKQTASVRCSKAPADQIHYSLLHFRRPPLYSRLFCLPFLNTASSASLLPFFSLHYRFWQPFVFVNSPVLLSVVIISSYFWGLASALGVKCKCNAEYLSTAILIYTV